MKTAKSKVDLADLQVNEYLGVDFSSPELTEENFASACRSERAELLHYALYRVGDEWGAETAA